MTKRRKGSYTWDFIDVTKVIDAKCCKLERSKTYAYTTNSLADLICKVVEITETIDNKRQVALFKLLNQEKY